MLLVIFVMILKLFWCRQGFICDKVFCHKACGLWECVAIRREGCFLGRDGGYVFCCGARAMFEP